MDDAPNIGGVVMNEELELIEVACIHCNHMVGLKVRVGEAVSVRCRDCKRVLYTREENAPAPPPVTVPNTKANVKPTIEAKAAVAIKSRGAPDNWISGSVSWKPGEVERARRLLNW